MDWASAGDEAARILSGYLRIPTVNPPGNETLGARYLADVLAGEGIESEVLEYAPGRGSLVARLPGSGELPPICLLSHIDVVPAEPEKWSRDPFSGEIDGDGTVWGRGALDMKGIGVLETMAMIWIKRLGIPLKRDVILLAVADEEVDNGGIRYLVEEHWDRIGCSHLVNEGGMGIRDAFFPGQTVFGISVAERGALWVRMTARGEPGHGSLPVPDRAPERLIRAIQKVAQRKAEPEVLPAMYEVLYRVGQTRKGLEKAVLTHPRAVRSVLVPRLMKDPLNRTLISDTVQLTGLAGAKSPNVVPSEVSAIYDCRLLPGHTPEAMLAELRALVDHDPNITFEVISELGSNVSSYDDPLFAALAAHLVRGRDDAVAGPVLSPGFTDSILVRPKGVNAYGIAPFSLTKAELRTMHGNDERVSVENLREGLRILFSTVVDVSAVPGAPVGPDKADR